MHLVLLVLKVNSGTLVVVLIKDIAGISLALFLPGRIVNQRVPRDDIRAAVVCVFDRLISVPRIAVVGGSVKTTSEGLCVDQSS